jgi:hypothetical protein
VIEPWLAAIRDFPEQPTAAEFRVLTMLAIRLTWKTMEGSASTADLVSDASASAAVVERATAWARTHGFLEQTRRGHRLDDGRVVKSCWRLIVPQPIATEGLGDLSTAETQPIATEGLGPPNPSVAETQPIATEGLSSFVVRVLDSRVSDHPIGGRRHPDWLASELRGMDDDEIDSVLARIRTDHGARTLGYIRRMAANGDLARYLACDRDGPDRHSDACRSGDSRSCKASWCGCRCHGKARPASAMPGESPGCSVPPDAKTPRPQRVNAAAGA